MIRGLGVRTWLRLTRTNQKLERAAAHHLKPFGLSLAQFDVLAHVRAAEGLPQQELAHSLLVTKGNVCQLVDRLQERGLIERRPNGRTNRLFLADAGRALCNEVVPSQEAAIEEALSVITAAEMLQLFGLLRKLDRALTLERFGHRGTSRPGPRS